jgi:hypothetical protein
MIYVQVANALRQPGSTLTSIAGTHFVYQHRIERPTAFFFDFEVFAGFYAVVVEQSLINLHLLGSVIMSKVSGRDSSGFCAGIGRDFLRRLRCSRSCCFCIFLAPRVLL